MAKAEIMGLRDWRLSQRHREWGYNAPACDLDFILAEYDHCTPVGLADYKHCAPSKESTVKEDASIKTLRALANMASLPAWVAIYRPWSWSFKVFSLNDRSRAVWGEQEYTYYTEREYVTKLHEMRGYTLPDEVAARLNTTHATLSGQQEDFDFLKHHPAPS